MGQSLTTLTAVRTGIVVLITLLASYYFSLPDAFFMILSAIFVMQTAVGSTAHQGLLRFIAILLSVIIGSLIVELLPYQPVMIVLSIIVFAIAAWRTTSQLLTSFQLSTAFLVAIMFALAVLTPLQKMEMRLFNVCIGGLIGLFSGLLIFPVHAEVEFRKKMVLLLTSCNRHLHALTNHLLDQTAVRDVDKSRQQIERAWEQFPEWVYEPGFISSFQKGHRHFLMRMDEVRQILYVLSSLVRSTYSTELLQQFRSPIHQYIDHVSQLIQALITVLTLQKKSVVVSDLSESFQAIETEFKRSFPVTLESIEIKSEYVDLTQFIYELKELGNVLLILAKSLRSSDYERLSLR